LAQKVRWEIALTRLGVGGVPGEGRINQRKEHWGAKPEREGRTDMVRESAGGLMIKKKNFSGKKREHLQPTFKGGGGKEKA